MIAKTEQISDIDRTLELLSPHAHDACVVHVFSDIEEIQRLLEFYSFKTPQLAERFVDRLSSRYRYEIFALYGTAFLSNRQSDSSYLRLEQLLSSLVRVAVTRLCCEGVYNLSPTQIAASDGLLYLALKKETEKESS